MADICINLETDPGNLAELLEDIEAKIISTSEKGGREVLLSESPGYYAGLESLRLLVMDELRDKGFEASSSKVMEYPTVIRVKW